jgi:hypothetical protein
MSVRHRVIESYWSPYTEPVGARNQVEIEGDPCAMK